MSEHAQRADHFQYLYEQASEGKCGHSGLTIGACKASICDCFEFPWVKPAPQEHPDPAPAVAEGTDARLTDDEYVLLTERCTERNCGTRVRYGELTDDANTHWHIKKGVALVPAARLAQRAPRAES